MRFKVDILKKDVGTTFFVLGLILSLALGFFKKEDETTVFLYLIVIFLGVVTGLLNLDKRKLNNFLLASTAFLVAIMIFSSFLLNLSLLYLKLGKEVKFIYLTKDILYSLALFISSALILPALKRTLYLLE